MSFAPLVTVIVPTFNRARYVGLAVESILNQTYRNLEVYIIDDGSTDETASVLAEYLKDPRVTYLTQPNAGQGTARNRGIKLSKGEYLAFLDADDIWIREKLALQVAAAGDRRDIGVFYTPCIHIDATNRIIEEPRLDRLEGNVTSELFIQNFVPFGTTFVKRECFETLGLFDEELATGEDYDLWLRFSRRYPFGFISTATLLYRLWPGQTTSDKTRVFENGIKIMHRFLKEFPNLIDKSTQDEGWAHTYVGFGRCVQTVDRRRIPALSHYARALRYKPFYIPAWKGLVKAMLGLHGRSS